MHSRSIRSLSLTLILALTLAGHSEEKKEWLPKGEWKLDWADEFEGKGEIKKWYPLLGYNHIEFQERESKGIRWSGSTEESSHMYSAKSGHHWLNGEGQLVMRIICDKNKKNEHGPRVEAAYLLSGYPSGWAKKGPSNSELSLIHI